MNEEVKTAWVEALRSGEYSQTTGYLRSPEGYCCLGVLCDVYRKTVDGAPDWETPPEGLQGFVLFDDAAGIPGVVAEWAELPHDSAVVNVPNPLFLDPIYDAEGEDPEVQAHLTEVNDEYGWSFEKIADLIEEQL